MDEENQGGEEQEISPNVAVRQDARQIKKGVEAMPYEPVTISKALSLIDSDGFDSWKTHLFQFVDDFRRSSDPAAAVAEKPESSFPRIEALGASTVQRLCMERRVPLPEWVRGVRPLPAPWFVSGFKCMRAMDLAESPCSFKIRNVFVPGDFLARV